MGILGEVVSTCMSNGLTIIIDRRIHFYYNQRVNRYQFYKNVTAAAAAAANKCYSIDKPPKFEFIKRFMQTTYDHCALLSLYTSNRPIFDLDRGGASMLANYHTSNGI